MFGSTKSIIRESASQKLIYNFLMLAVGLVCLSISGAAYGQVVQTYYIPMPEDAAILDTMQTLDPAGGDDPIWPVTTQISIAIPEDGTIIYWDHFEDDGNGNDGYESDISAPTQANTEVWGDNDPSNGIPPGFTTDLLNAGDVVYIEEAIPESPAVDYYNGGDKVAATAPISLTRSSYATGTGALLAGAAQVGAVEYETWGTAFISPVGVDMAETDDNQMFEYTALYVQARTAGTTLSLNGVEITGTDLPLGEGKGYTLEGVNVGDVLTSNNDIQVFMITGDIGVTWELRWYSLLPTAAWHNEYYSPVGTGGGAGCTSVWLHNPDPINSITVNFEYTDGSQCAVDVPAGESRESTSGSCSQLSGTYRDEFSTANYNNSDGTLAWSSNSWVETNDNGSPTSGYVYITGGELVMRGSGQYNIERVIQRTLDLSTATGAVFSFDIRTAGDLGASDYIVISVSGNGGSSWRVLETIYNDVTASRSYTLLPAELSSNAMIEFRSYNYGGSGGSSSYYEYYYIDDVQIEADGMGTPSTYAAPPVPEGSGARFWTEGTTPPAFLALSTTDCNGGQVYDWGFSMIPADQLTPQVLVGGAPGCTDADCGGGDNRSPVWVTPVSGTRIYADLDGSGYNCDPANLSPTFYDVNALASVKIEDTTDNDMSSALIFTCDETPIAAAWGQDPSRSYSGDSQGLDMGTGILPLEKLFTPVLITSFNAYEEAGRNIVEWQTASESGTKGFHLLKKDPRTGLFKRLNTTLLPSLFSVPQGGTYRFVDPTGGPGETRTYKLVAVEKKRKRIRFGPFTVDTGAVEKRSKTALYKTDVQASKMKADIGYQATPKNTSTHKQLRGEALQKARQLSVAVNKNKRGQKLKLAVKEEGLYYVDAGTIAQNLGKSLGVVKRWIKKSELRLVNKGKKVAYLPARGNAGIYFYGQAPVNPYSDVDIYWLIKGKGLKMKTPKGKAPKDTAPADQVFTATHHAEENHYALTALFEDPEDDYWLWEFVIAGNATYGSRSFVLPSHGRAPVGTANLNVMLQGGIDADHSAQIYLNGQLIGEASWSGAVPNSLDLEIQADQLVDGENDLTVSGLLPEGTAYSNFFIESFDVAYPRYYQAHDGQLTFAGKGKSTLTVSGFKDHQVMVFDISNPRQPKYIAKTAIGEQAAGDFQVSFRPLRKAASQYLAVVPDAVITDIEIWTDSPSNLAKRSNRADYLVIAPAHLTEAAQQLAAYRQANGYQTMVIDLEDIYDEANNGNASPEAIRDFLAHAHKKWRTPPKYAVLVGDGTYDYKDYQGQGDCLMPVMMMTAPHGLFASDNSYGDFDGDGVPEVVVGRLPVATPEELQTLVGKMMAYETGGEWKNRVVLAAGAPDEGGNFPFDSDAIEELVPSEYAVTKVYVPEFDTPAEAHDAMLDAINGGAMLVNYIGHAGPLQLGSSGMLTVTDVPGLSNFGQYPIITAMTCYAGRFSIPGFDSIGEQLLLAPDGGAAAVWAPSGLSKNDEAKLLGKGFAKAIFQQQSVTLGDAVKQAMVDAQNKGIMQYLPALYILLGDPAMPVR